MPRGKTLFRARARVAARAKAFAALSYGSKRRSPSHMMAWHHGRARVTKRNSMQQCSSQQHSSLPSNLSPALTAAVAVLYILARGGGGLVDGRGPSPAAVYTASNAAIFLTASAGQDFIVYALTRTTAVLSQRFQWVRVSRACLGK